MNNNLVTYTLIKSFYEEKKDYIDTFIPFVIKCLPDDQKESHYDFLQGKIKKEYSLEIPMHSIETICKRAEKIGLVCIRDKKMRKVNLTAKGLKSVDKIMSYETASKQTDKLVAALKSFIRSEKGLDVSVEDDLFAFVQENFIQVLCYFDHSKCEELVVKNTPDRNSQLITQFIIKIKEDNNELFNILQDVVAGSVLSTIVSTDLTTIAMKFKKVKFALDSNFIFSLLDLHYEEVNKPAAELLKLLKKTKVQLCVFDFTVEEIVHVLSKYTSEAPKYFMDWNVNSIYSKMKINGITETNLSEYIRNIERKIQDLGIMIIPTGNPNYIDYEPSTEWVEALHEAKSNDAMYSVNVYKHDLLAIETVKRMRGSKRVRKLEDSRIVFLTSDNRLAKVNITKFGNNEHTIPEVVLDKIVTNILWLKEPLENNKILFNNLFALHSQTSFIDKNVWERFVVGLKNMHMDGTIGDEDIQMLFWDESVRKHLLEIDRDNEMHKLSQTNILKLISDQKANYSNKQDSIRNSYMQRINLKVDEVASLKKELVHSNRVKLLFASKCAGVIAVLFILLLTIILFPVLKEITYLAINQFWNDEIDNHFNFFIPTYIFVITFVWGNFKYVQRIIYNICLNRF